MPHVLSDILVTLKDPAMAKSTEAVVDELREALAQVPGPAVLFTTPLGMRIDEGLGGTPAQLSIRVFGPDLEVLNQKAGQIADAARGVRGVTDLRSEEASDVPQLQVSFDRPAAARLGVTAGELAEAVRVGLAGEEMGTVWCGQRNYAVVLRMSDAFRDDARAIAALPIGSARGPVQLGQVARLDMREGPSIIRRENVQRRVAVEGSIERRDLGSAVAELQRHIAKVSLPAGYRIDFGGEFEQQQRALRALEVALALALAFVLVLLFMALGSFSEVAVILLTLPDAFVGAILAMLLSGQTVNVSSAIGFIGLFGIAVQNGLVLISQTRGLTRDGLPFHEALRTASIGRVRPKLMTAGCAMLGLLPLVLLHGQGSELERPLAIVMIGGLVTSTLFTLLALPTFYSLVTDVRARFARDATANS
jgi:cobalt-zinc-cadmium resistance protein CzcA